MAARHFSYPASLHFRASAARKSSLRHSSLSMPCSCHLHRICHQPCSRGLTLRSTGPATAGGVSLARSGFATVARQAYTACLRGPVSSNVRPRRRDLLLSKMQLLGFASAIHQPQILPRGAGLQLPVWRQAALAIPHRFVIGHLQRAKAACGTVRCAWRAPATSIASATNRAGVA